jgi:predicted Zn-dependent protease with MMP-like domain
MGTSVDVAGYIVDMCLPPIYTIDPAKPLDDGSNNVDTPYPKTGRGRYENGQFRVITTGATGHALLKNGHNSVYFVGSPSLMPIDISILYYPSRPGYIATGYIGNIIPASLTHYGYQIGALSSTQNPFIWTDMLGGDLQLGNTGLPVPVWYVNASLGLVAPADTQMRVPFEIHDDDEDSILPVNVAVPFGVPILDMPIGLLINAMKPAYVLPQIDGGNSIANNQANVAFIGNMTAQDLQSAYMQQDTPEDASSRFFWTAYVVASFQGREATTGTDIGDWDPDAVFGLDEYGIAGETYGPVLGATAPWTFGQGCNSAWIFLETIRDMVANGGYDSGHYERTIAHEIGHCFGLAHHGDMGLHTDTIMETNPDDPAINILFNDMQIHLIRSRFEALWVP